MIVISKRSLCGRSRRVCSGVSRRHFLLHGIGIRTELLLVVLEKSTDMFACHSLAEPRASVPIVVVSTAYSK